MVNVNKIVKQMLIVNPVLVLKNTNNVLNVTQDFHQTMVFVNKIVKLTLNVIKKKVVLLSFHSVQNVQIYLHLMLELVIRIVKKIHIVMLQVVQNNLMTVHSV